MNFVPPSLDFQIFVQNNLAKDPTQLLLHPPEHTGIDLRMAASQVAARQKAKTKLPTWFAHPAIWFPAALSVEQASSEQAAAYKASLVAGRSLLDLTGGLGVDTAAFSEVVDTVQYVERQAALAEVAAYNLALLGHTNVVVNTAEAEDFLGKHTQTDWVYLDPHRRDTQQKKVISLAECEPNILAIQSLIFEKTSHILLKTSPLLDIQQALRQLTQVAAVHIVAVENEVKELLFHLQKKTPEVPIIHAVHLSKNQAPRIFSFAAPEEQLAAVRLAPPQRYLYEPSAALLKAGAFKLVGARAGLAKLHPHTHLYTSEQLSENFMGRAFEILQICKLDKAQIMKHLPDKKAHITVRNFPLTVAEIRKKIGVLEGGDVYLFATTDAKNHKIVLVCQKVS
jgi:16S rRNA G966 N2-methylase RsmD